jgi:ABC-type multidrug transport system ATPase subunit
MLKTSNLSVYAHQGASRTAILKGVNFEARCGELVAIVGPSGCGKSTFLKAIAGLVQHTEGQMSWFNREIGEDYDIAPEMLAYVPQFAIFHEELTVEEILTDAAVLRLGRIEGTSVRMNEVAELTGLSELRQRPAKILSGGEKRRLALAMELVSEPAIILADEVTSGLDPKSAFEITALLRSLAKEKKKIVLHVTHELKHFHYYDSIVVLAKGAVVFQGTPSGMLSYFQVRDADDIFKRLGEIPIKNQTSIPQIQGDRSEDNQSEPEIHGVKPTTGFTIWIAQLFCLSRRRMRIFARKKAQIILQLLLVIVFPVIVVLFALKGLPEIQNMSLDLETNPARMLQETLDFSSQVSRVGRLVSGLAMFQVILLALMGANNAAREIAAERSIFEKEKLSGASTSAYLGSKLLFLALLVSVQSFWMTILVKEVCQLPGSFRDQFIILGLVNISMTSLSLAISSWSRTAEQASLTALYIVGFQLPLSGAVLALPDWLGTVTRPFIAAYWSWSGYLQTLKETRFYDLVAFASSAALDSWLLCVTVLVFQSVVAIVVAYLGCYRSSYSE